MNTIDTAITRNILKQLKKQNLKQNDLAEGIGTTKQVISKILNGARMVNASELHKIANYLHVSMDELVSMPAEDNQPDVIRAFMGKVNTEEAKKALEIADEVADLILFHSKVMNNAKEMMQPWED